jgi:hypothetical protein
MKKIYSTFFFSLLIYLSFYAQEKYVTLPNSTLVVVKTVNEFSAENLKTGQEITCVVALDVIIESDTLIKAGAPVFCMVEDANAAGMVGQGANLIISIQNTVSVDGKNIVLSGNFRTKGQSSTGEKVAVGVILCPFALLCKGEEATVPVGSQTRAFTIGEFKIKVKK